MDQTTPREDGKPKLVILWAVYRSLSSAISRSFRQRPDTRVHFEPFTMSYYFSEERTSTRHEDVYVQDRKALNYSAQWQKILAEPQHGESLIFVKDFPMCIPRDKWLHEGLS